MYSLANSEIFNVELLKRLTKNNPGLQRQMIRTCSLGRPVLCPVVVGPELQIFVVSSFLLVDRGNAL